MSKGENMSETEKKKIKAFDLLQQIGAIEQQKQILMKQYNELLEQIKGDVGAVQKPQTKNMDEDK